MKTTTLLTAGAALLLAFGCATTPAGPPPLAVADYAAILTDASRPADDAKDDAARKPSEVLAFAGLRPGDTVLEMEGGRGWYSYIISKAIGPEGKLIVQYPPEFAYGDPAYQARVDGGQLPNAVITKTHFDKLEAADGSVDKVLWILGPHEVWYTPKDTDGLGDPAKSFTEIARVLKPGGEFIAMDHAAVAGTPAKTSAQTLHRIDPAHVLEAAKTAGFVYVDKSDVLANPEDDRTKSPFAPDLRRHTDQFLFRFRKP
ncbi:MAG: methyltransferase domain-containing protein [Hyphomonadaceae bacterium]